MSDNHHTTDPRRRQDPRARTGRKLADEPGFRHQAEHIAVYVLWLGSHLLRPVLNAAFGRRHSDARLLEQILYWSCDRDGITKLTHRSFEQLWLVKADHEWHFEISIAESTATGARKRLVDLGLVRTDKHRAGTNAGGVTTHYQVQFSELLKFLAPASLRYVATLHRACSSLYQTKGHRDVAGAAEAASMLGSYLEPGADTDAAWTSAAAALLERMEGIAAALPQAARRTDDLVVSLDRLFDAAFALTGIDQIPQSMRDHYRSRCGDVYSTTHSTTEDYASHEIAPARTTSSLSHRTEVERGREDAVSTSCPIRPTSSPAQASGDGCMPATEPDVQVEICLPVTGSRGQRDLQAQRPVLGDYTPSGDGSTGTPPLSGQPAQGDRYDLQGARAALRDDLMSYLHTVQAKRPRAQVGEATDAFTERLKAFDGRLRSVAFDAIRTAIGASTSQLQSKRIRAEVLDRFAQQNGLEVAVERIIDAAARGCGRYADATSLLEFIRADLFGCDAVPPEQEIDAIECVWAALYDRYDPRLKEKSLAILVASCCYGEAKADKELYTFCNTLVNKTRQGRRWDRTPFVEALVEAALRGRSVRVFLGELVARLGEPAARNVAGELRRVAWKGYLQDERLRSAVDEFCGAPSAR